MTISMIVPPNKVNLAERDIEDWLYENPSAITLNVGPISQWIARQYSMPSGIADLIGIVEPTGSIIPETVVVVEVKNVAINKAAILQVCRYKNDLKHILTRRIDAPAYQSGEPWVSAVVVGPSIDDQTFSEARACGVAVIRFGVSLQLTLAQLNWSNEYRERLDEEYSRIARQPEWNRYGEHIEDHIERVTQEDTLADELDDELNGTIGAA